MLTVDGVPAEFASLRSHITDEDSASVTNPTNLSRSALSFVGATPK